jgi:hypothetical protein
MWNCRLLKDALLTAEAACRVWRRHFFYAPFLLRMDEPTYKVELMDWGV